MARVFSAVLVGLIGGFAAFLGGYFIKYLASVAQHTPPLLYVVAGGFILAGMYLVTSAFRLARFKGPLADASDPEQSLKAQRFLIVLGAILAAVMALTSQRNGWEMVLQFIGVFVILIVNAYLVVAFHEGGHALASLEIGSQLKTIRIGTGRDIISFRLGNAQVRVGALPFTGYVLALPDSGKWERWNLFIFSAAGPLVSFGVTFALWRFFQAHGIFLSLTQDAFWKTALVYLFFQNILVNLSFFRIRDVTVDGMKLKPDLALMLHCLFASKSKWESSSTATNTVQDLINRGLDREAWNIVRPQLFAHPGFAGYMAHFAQTLGAEEASFLQQLAEETLAQEGVTASVRCLLLVTQGMAQVQLSQIEFARAKFAEAVQVAPTDEERISVYEYVANLVIMNRKLAYLPDADAASEAALRLRPAAITLYGTRGSILVEMNRLQEGVPMLEKVFSETESHFDKTICAFYLALAHHRLGNTSQVQPWREKMALHNPPPWLVRRLPELAA